MKKIFLALPEFADSTCGDHSELLKPYLSDLSGLRLQPAQECFISTHAGYSGVFKIFNFLIEFLPDRVYKSLLHPSKDLNLVLESHELNNGFYKILPAFIQTIVKEFLSIHQDSRHVMQSIIDATRIDEINIVHIASCHASLAHRSLDRLDGNICLVTYSNWMHSALAGTQDKLLSHHREKTDYTSVLTKYFSAYIAYGLEVSYKIDGKIYNYKVDNRDIQSSLLSANSPDYIPRIILQESRKWLEFYNELHDKFSGRYAILFPKRLQSEDCLSPDHLHPDALIQGVLDLTTKDEEIATLLKLATKSLAIQNKDVFLQKHKDTFFDKIILTSSDIEKVLLKSSSDQRKEIVSKINHISNEVLKTILAIVSDDLELSKSVVTKAESPIAFYAIPGVLELVKEKELLVLVLEKVEKISSLDLLNCLHLASGDLELSKLAIEKAESPIAFYVIPGILGLVKEKELLTLILNKADEIPDDSVLTSLYWVKYDLDLSKLVIAKAKSPIDSSTTKSILELMGDSSGIIALLIEERTEAISVADELVSALKLAGDDSDIIALLIEGSNDEEVVTEVESTVKLAGDVGHCFINSDIGSSCMSWIYLEL